MLSAASQLEASLKKCVSDVPKHVAGLAAAAERNEKKRKDKEAWDAESEQTKAKLKQATADGADMAAVFRLAPDDLMAMSVLEGNAIPGDHVMSIPIVIKKSSHVQARKKAPGFDSNGRLAPRPVKSPVRNASSTLSRTSIARWWIWQTLRLGG